LQLQPPRTYSSPACLRRHSEPLWAPLLLSRHAITNYHCWSTHSAEGCVHHAFPLQITDDSEMALCLAQALVAHPASEQLPMNDIAFWYGKWIQSPPFDIGALHAAHRMAASSRCSSVRSCAVTQQHIATHVHTMAHCPVLTLQDLLQHAWHTDAMAGSCTATSGLFILTCHACHGLQASPPAMRWVCWLASPTLSGQRQAWRRRWCKLLLRYACQ
jgi:hypothetical protein